MRTVTETVTCDLCKEKIDPTEQSQINISVSPANHERNEYVEARDLCITCVSSTVLPLFFTEATANDTGTNAGAGDSTTIGNSSTDTT